MPTAEIVKIGEVEYTARTLAVKDVIAIFEQADGKKADVIDLLFEDGLDSTAFYVSLGIGREAIEGLTPEDVKILMEAVAKANPTYAGMERRLRARQAELRKILSAPAAV
jgi:hypothetical protein